MSLVPNNAGLGGGTAHHAWNTPPIQLAGSFGRPGLSPKIAPSLPPTQPSTVVEGVVSAFVKICQRWRLSVDQQVILLGYKGNDFLGRQILESDILSPPQDVRDRARHIVTISLGLGALFENVERAELDWLNANRDDLNQRSPLEYMLEGHMANVVEISRLMNYERGF